MISVGKFKDFTYEDKVQHYDEIQFDMLYFLLEMTKVQRFISRESFKEFLIRLFLISQKNLDEYAIDIIDEELLIDGLIGEKYFSIKIKDLENLIGFSISNAKYNIVETTEHFIKNFKLQLPSIKFIKDESSENTYHISKQALVYGLSGLGNLLNIESCSLKFNNNLDKIKDNEIEAASKLADFIITRLPSNLFEQYYKDFSFYIDKINERYLLNELIKFNVYKDMDQENLAKIYEIIYDKETADFFRLNPNDEDLIHDLRWHNEQINFAYGVKHGYIELSDYYDSLMTCVDPQFDYDYDLLLGSDFEMYSTRCIYEANQMSEWQHLLP
jgi:hypothetical protein